MERREFIQRLQGIAALPYVFYREQVENKFREEDYESIFNGSRFIKGRDCLPLIIDACNKTRDNFVVTPEVAIVNLFMESSFNARAVSNFGAVGLGQFIAETAEPYGSVYVDENYRIAKRLHDEHKRLSQLIEGRTKILESLSVDDFNRLKEIFRNRRVVGEERRINFSRYEKNLLTVTKDMRLDELAGFEWRLHEELAIHRSVNHLSNLGEEIKNELGIEEYPYVVLIAIAAYNSGMGAVNGNRGVPPYGETMRHINKFMKYYSEAIKLKSRIS